MPARIPTRCWDRGSHPPGQPVPGCGRRPGVPGRHWHALGYRTAVSEIHGLLSVNLMDAVTGVKTELIPIPELAAMGVARVSIPVASIMVMHKALKDFFEALHASPTGILAGETDRITGFQEYTAFVGLPEYRALEREYLPAKENHGHDAG